jgi:hypothetical protein
MSWLQRLKGRWKVDSVYQVIVILFVFACTGFTVLLIKKPLFRYWFAQAEMPTWASVLYYILILPIYNVFLLLYGFLLGQFQFFWDFEKRFFARMVSFFSPRK